MGYGEYLKALLRPLGVYELEGGVGAAELAALGEMFDGAVEKTDELDRECTVGTAQGYGLELYEKLLPYKPVADSPENRRRALAALMSIDGTSFTEDKLNYTLTGCGISAEVKETDKWYTVEITFPEVRGMPGGIEEIKKRIEEILPCQLEVLYEYVYCTWAELEREAFTWGRLTNMTWEQTEKYIPG